MERIHVPELEDESWFPGFLRNAIVEYLRWVEEKKHIYRPVAEKFFAVLNRLGCRKIVDLCSGTACPAVQMVKEYNRVAAEPVQVIATDKFPNVPALEQAQAEADGHFQFVADSVDATSLPRNLKGMRTLFASFHHFRPDTARAILQDAVDQRSGIAVFEHTERSARTMLLFLAVPLLTAIAMLVMRPLKGSRLLWTFLVPLIPLVVFWDGIASCLRTYSPKEMEDLVRAVEGHQSYVWDIGTIPGKGLALTVTYLIGHPG